MMPGANEIHIDALEFFRPPAIERPSQAARRLFLPQSSRPGPFLPEAYQAQILDTFADPNVDTIVLALASQTGKSTIETAMMATAMFQAPGPMMLVHPTDKQGAAWIRDTFDPICAASPDLRSRIGAGGQRNGGDSLRAKVFPGGYLNVASSYKPDDLAARPIRYLFCDEVDRFAQSAGSEGNPVALAIKRTLTWRGRGRKIVIASTPTEKSASRIWEEFRLGDQREFYVPCPSCGAMDYLRWDRVHWTKGDPESARIACTDCDHRMTETERRTAIDAGEFLPTAQGQPGVVSFHATVLISKMVTLASVVQEFENAGDDLRVFTNTALAEPYDGGADTKLDAAALQDRAEPIRSPFPKDMQFIVAGADVQSDRIELTYLGVGKASRSWVLNHVVLRGDTSGVIPFRLLDEALGATFRTIDGRTLSVHAAAVDSGFNASQVYTFVDSQRAKNRRVIAVKGVTGWGKPTIARSRGGRAGLHLVGVDAVKASVMKRLAMAELAPGFIHLPDHLLAEYFEGLASEKLAKRFVRGYVRLEFHMTKTSGNEPLDCLVYAVALASIIKTPTDKSLTPGASR